jgi:molybdenum cofactor biosynthesis enzyme
VEVEAMRSFGGSTYFYDMLKPIDKEIEIKNIKLLEKKVANQTKKTILIIR